MMDTDVATGTSAPAGAAEAADDDVLPSEHGWQFIDDLVKETFTGKDPADKKGPLVNFAPGRGVA